MIARIKREEHAQQYIKCFMFHSSGSDFPLENTHSIGAHVEKWISQEVVLVMDRLNWYMYTNSDCRAEI